jgi:hypothetical protein
MTAGQRWAVALSLVVLLAGPLEAQTTSSSVPGSTAAGSGAAGQNSQAAGSQPAAQAPQQNAPEPYDKDEFPRWAQDLWRGEVIFFGAFPFAIFFTLEGYDVYKYAASGFSSSMTPWPIRSSSDIKYSVEEQIWLIVVAAAVSLVVSVTDYLLRRLTSPDEAR